MNIAEGGKSVYSHNGVEGITILLTHRFFSDTKISIISILIFTQLQYFNNFFSYNYNIDFIKNHFLYCWPFEPYSRESHMNPSLFIYSLLY